MPTVGGGVDEDRLAVAIHHQVAAPEVAMEARGDFGGTASVGELLDESFEPFRKAGRNKRLVLGQSKQGADAALSVETGPIIDRCVVLPNGTQVVVR